MSSKSKQGSKTQSKHKTKSTFDHWLVGSSTTVLKSDFIQQVEDANSFDDITMLPFSGALVLPTKMQALKLLLFLRDTVGKFNKAVSRTDIAKLASNLISKYWDMAGFSVVANVYRSLLSLYDKYEKIKKSENKKMNDNLAQTRKNFLGDMETLFDIATKGLEVELTKDRIRANVDAVGEDVSFLLDQRGPRDMVMSRKVDLEFQARKEAQLQREQTAVKRSRAASTAPSTVTSGDYEAILNDDDDVGSVQVIPEPSQDDPDYNCNVKRSKTVILEVPRNFLSSPALTASLDRDKLSNYAATRVLSTFLRDQRTSDGNRVDLNDFSISKDTIARARNKSRDELAEQAREKFVKDKPEFAVVHSDGKLMGDYLGICHESQAVVVSGAPHYNEGKVLGMILIYHFISFLSLNDF